MIDLEAAARLLLVFAHLLLCVFALREVLVADWQLLRRGLHRQQMLWLHRRVGWLLAGLWLTGLAIVGLDTGFDPALLVQYPKLLTKLLVVVVLTLNGLLLLRGWCFDRVGRLAELALPERLLVLMAGATSTASWLFAAFLGTARPLRDLPLPTLLTAYGAVLLLAALAATGLALWRWPQAKSADADALDVGSAQSAMP